MREAAFQTAVILSPSDLADKREYKIRFQVSTAGMMDGHPVLTMDKEYWHRRTKGFIQP